MFVEGAILVESLGQGVEVGFGAVAGIYKGLFLYPVEVEQIHGAVSSRKGPIHGWDLFPVKVSLVCSF